MISPDNMVTSYDSTNVFAQYHTLQQDRSLVVRQGEKGHQLYSFEYQNEGMIEIGFNLGGEVVCNKNRISSKDETIVIEHGQVHVGSTNGTLVFSSDQPVCWIGIVLPVAMANEHLGEPLADLAGRGTVKSEACCISKKIGSITTDMKVSLHQIVQCPFLGKTKCLFLESKVLELISHVRFSLEQVPESSAQKTNIYLNMEDKEKMWRAKAFLDENLEVPPSIVELAQYVGVNEYKLKNGFRQEHGITPYRYIVEQRLKRARKLLWNRDMNVTEAAFAVGYSSLSHFAKIFRDKFGVNPHEYLA